MQVNNRTIYSGIIILIFGVMLGRFFTENYGLSYGINVFFDVWLLILLLFSLIINRRKLFHSSVNALWGFLIATIMVVIISLAYNGGTTINNFYYSARPYFRMIATVFLGYEVLSCHDFETIYKYIKWLMIINVPVMTVQYFVFNLSQDWIGGTFGNTPGCNNIQNLLSCFLVVYVILNYLYKRKTLKEVLLIIGITVYISALAEITVYFVELIVIFCLSIFMAKRHQIKVDFNFRKIFLIGLGFIAVVFGIRLYLKVFPERAFLLSINNMLAYLGANDGNTGVYQISRIRVFNQLTDMFFNSFTAILFGFGLGNCSIHSSFYGLYGNMLNYHWMSSAITFLETGAIGVMCNLGLFICIFVGGGRIAKSAINRDELILINMAQIMSVLCVIYFFYSTPLRDTYTSFFIGIILSAFWVVKRQCFSRKRGEHCSSKQLY